MSTTANLMNPPALQSNRARLFWNLIIAPEEAFAEVASSRATFENWFLPTLMTIAVGLVTAIGLENSGSLPGTEELMGIHRLEQIFAIISSVGVGTLWSALILFLISRIAFGNAVPFEKTLEAAGLINLILALGAVSTFFLSSLAGSPTQPAVSVLLSQFDPTNPGHQFLQSLNLFQLWATVLLAIALSKLNQVSFSTAGFWVFGYWVALKWSLILLQTR